MGCEGPEVPAVAGADLVLVPGVDCERFDLAEPKDIPESLFSSREDLLEFSLDEDCAGMNEIHEFRLREVGIFCVSIAAGGCFLLNRLPAFTSVAFCRSSSCLSFLSRSLCSLSAFRFSFFLAFSPWSDQLGERQISAGFSSRAMSVLTVNGVVFATG